MIIKKNDEFINQNNQLVRITGKHFSNYAVDVFEYNDDSENYDIYDSSTIYTISEVKRLADAKEITWNDDTDDSKTDYQWQEEAENFISEWIAATGKRPELSDVIAECKDIGIDNAEEYAEKLYSFM